MMRVVFILFMIFISHTVRAFSWQDLWLTADQQGQILVQKGEFAKAKDVFVNKDWAGFASYKASDYKQAANLFNQMQSHYNLGNALAHLQKYQQAIAEYDKALSLDPNDKDAKFNRKLLKDLLKKNKDQKNENQQNKEEQDQQNKDQQNKDQQNKDQQNKDQQNKDQQNKDQQNKDKQNKDKQNKDKQNKDKQNKDKPEQEPQKKDQQYNDPLNQNIAKQSESSREKQQAKQQWLQLIPDDPGGLMRQKFLRDHLRRENGWNQ